MAENHSPTTKLTFVLIFILGCAVIGGVLWSSMALIDRAEQHFGLPRDGFDRLQLTLHALDLMRYEKELLQPVVFPDAAQREFRIELGEPVQSITQRLEEGRFILSAEALETYLVYSGLDLSIQAGQYQIPSGLTTVDLARKFQDATPDKVSFGVLAGWRLEEIAAVLPTSGLNISSEVFLRAARQKQMFMDYEWADAESAEGFLFSGIYQISRTASAYDLLRMMMDQFDAEITADLRLGFAQQGLSLEEAVILASIVQREAVIVEEQPLIASVFLNRLAVGMRLESDPTVQYALGYVPTAKSWWKNPLTLTDLKVDSSYNTYQNAGLPPGPICNPSLGALQAVAFPAQSPYYFFRARCDGSGYHHFSVTFEEHLQKACP
jgi:UPF0755 protein